MWRTNLKLFKNATIDEELKAIEVEEENDEDDPQVDLEPEPMDGQEPADESDIVGFLEIEEMLRKITVSAPGLGVKDASLVHLDRFARALRTARAEKVAKPKGDGSLHAYFPTLPKK